MKKVLVLAGHRYPDESRVNHAAIEALKALPQVTVHELMREYPDFRIDVKREQALLLAHDAVVMLFPFWWYSAPAILKEWQDHVLEHGFAYGSGGDRLHGKPFMLMVSTGGNAQAYSSQGYNRYPIEEFWLPFRATANMTGMVWQTPALIQGTHVLSDAELDAGIAQWLSRVNALVS
ncbi:NAD(P)H-dependent oxidoreductase [Cronobacter dublinensis]|uniref:NAD(P)H-dependent oxidoreductase n=1 Tax=Cronobacter dublinensis TaxID=413497 RepID=UPI000CFFE927|nr:NAD(P)H-dependent oxidoreductase [Cronobacter dublinensis]